MHQQLNDITLKLFKYFDTHFRRVEQRIKEQDQHIDGLYKLVDAYAKQAESKLLNSSIDDVRILRLEQKVLSLRRQARNRTLPR